MGDFCRKRVLENSGHVQTEAFSLLIQPVGQGDIAADHLVIHASAIDGKVDINQCESPGTKINIFSIFLSFADRFGVRGSFGKIFLVIFKIDSFQSDRISGHLDGISHGLALGVASSFVGVMISAVFLEMEAGLFQFFKEQY